MYVTDKIRERGCEIADLLLNRGAYLYICGDGNSMAKDVHRTIVELLVSNGHRFGEVIDNDEAAEEIIEDLKFRRRFVLDIWS